MKDVKFCPGHLTFRPSVSTQCAAVRCHSLLCFYLFWLSLATGDAAFLLLETATTSLYQKWIMHTHTHTDSLQNDRLFSRPVLGRTDHHPVDLLSDRLTNVWSPRSFRMCLFSSLKYINWSVSDTTWSLNAANSRMQSHFCSCKCDVICCDTHLLTFHRCLTAECLWVFQ